MIISTICGKVAATMYVYSIKAVRQEREPERFLRGFLEKAGIYEMEVRRTTKKEKEEDNGRDTSKS